MCRSLYHRCSCSVALWCDEQWCGVDCSGVVWCGVECGMEWSVWCGLRLLEWCGVAAYSLANVLFREKGRRWRQRLQNAMHHPLC